MEELQESNSTVTQDESAAQSKGGELEKVQLKYKNPPIIGFTLVGSIGGALFGYD